MTGVNNFKIFTLLFFSIIYLVTVPIFIKFEVPYSLLGLNIEVEFAIYIYNSKNLNTKKYHFFYWLKQIFCLFLVYAKYDHDKKLHSFVLHDNIHLKGIKFRDFREIKYP